MGLRDDVAKILIPERELQARVAELAREIDAAYSDADRLLLVVEYTPDRFKLKTYGDRSFSSCAPRLWNSLPGFIRESDSTNVFKKNRKTYLFKVAFFK